MKCIKTLPVYLLTLVAVIPLQSQELLSKEEAVDYTLSYNLGIEIAENNTEIAENNAGVLNSGYLPTLTAGGGASLNRSSSNGELANGDPIGQDNETRNYRANLDLDYVLFDGLGRHYNYKSLKEQKNLTELQTRETIETTLLQMFSVYYEVARLSENVGNLEQALEISKDRLERAKYQFEYGQSTGLDVLNAEVDVNTDSINLINARQVLRNTKRDLNLIMNRDLESRYKVDTLVTFIPGILMEDMLEQARVNNVTLLQAKSGELINEYGIKATRSGFLPTVGLFGSYGWNRNENEDPLIFQAKEITSNGLTAGLNLTWNIFDGGRTMTQFRNSKIDFRNQELARQQVELNVERNIRNAWESYKNALFIYEAQKKNVATAENNFNRTSELLKYGRATSLEFRQAQINLLNAILNKNQAKYSAKIAELAVLQVSGQLLNVNF